MAISIKAITDRIKSELSDVDAPDDKRIEHAIDKTLDDMALRVKGKGIFDSYNISLAAGDQTKTLKGNQNDLKGIIIIKVYSSTEKWILHYKDDKDFISNYDDPDVSAGKPLYYTVIATDDGFPKIRFDRPTDTAYTMTVYYYIKGTKMNVSSQFSMAALVDGSVARFYGLADTRGAVYYKNFEKQCALTRGKETFTPDVANEIPLSQEDKSIRVTLNAARNKRT